MDQYYEFNIGDLECIAINDGGFTGNESLLFANAPQDALQQTLNRYGLNGDQLKSTWTCLLVKTPEHIVLLDTGGNNVMALGGGKLLTVLAQKEITPGDIGWSCGINMPGRRCVLRFDMALRTIQSI